jgi:hypothetical protein
VTCQAAEPRAHAPSQREEFSRVVAGAHERTLSVVDDSAGRRRSFLELALHRDGRRCSAILLGAASAPALRAAIAHVRRPRSVGAPLACLPSSAGHHHRIATSQLGAPPAVTIERWNRNNRIPGGFELSGTELDALERALDELERRALP